MTLSEMHRALRLQLDKSQSLDYPDFLPEEIDYWLNKAYLELITQKAFGTNYRQETFEGSVKRIDDLRPLLKTTKLTPIFSPYSSATSINNYANGLLVELDSAAVSDYMYYVSSRIQFPGVIPTSNKTSYRSVKLIKHSEKDKYTWNDLNYPYIPEPVAFFNGFSFATNYDNVLVILIDPHELDLLGSPNNDIFELTYIKKPTVLNISSPTQVPELPFHCHEEIVTLTTNMLLENIEHTERIQTHELQLRKTE